MSRVYGLDISQCQGIVDYDKLPKRIQFVIVKVSEGESYKDPLRLRNLAEARARGLRVLVYAFFRSSQDPEKQAQNLWDAVGDISPSFVFIDFETIADGLSPAAAVAKLAALGRAVRAMFGRGGVYSFPYFCTGAMGVALAACPELALLAFFAADYRGGEDPPPGWKSFCPKPWTRATFVQTSGDNSSMVPGIVGHVDHDFFDGDWEAFIRFLGEPTADQLEPDAPIVHVDPSDYAGTDDPPFDPT